MVVPTWDHISYGGVDEWREGFFEGAPLGGEPDESSATIARIDFDGHELLVGHPRDQTTDPCGVESCIERELLLRKRSFARREPKKHVILGGCNLQG